jgi:hypothetical protein
LKPYRPLLQMSAPEVKGMKGTVSVAGNAHFRRPTRVGQRREFVGRDSSCRIKHLHQQRRPRVRQPFMFHYQRCVGVLDVRCRSPRSANVVFCGFL